MCVVEGPGSFLVLIEGDANLLSAHTTQYEEGLKLLLNNYFLEMFMIVGGCAIRMRNV